jgi:hypothetical protein
VLSKCLNPHCSATFQHLGQGRLFRINFTEASRKSALAGKKAVACIRSKNHAIEHFWLCEKCAATMTVELSDACEVRLIPLQTSLRKPCVVAFATDTQDGRGDRFLVSCL